VLLVLAVLNATACSDKVKPPEQNPPEETPPPPPPPPVTKNFTNPLQILIPGGGRVETCADPTVIRGQQQGDTAWYMYCTTDPLNDQDKDTVTSRYRFHRIPILKSDDLVNWTYAGDALSAPPSWAKPDTGLWAPEVVFFGGKYYLYYTVVDTVAGGSAIGVATSTSPLGPWAQSDKPAVEPHEAACCAGSRRWVFDPEVLLTSDGSKYIYYGSYFGGISVRKLSEDGMTSDVSSQVEVTIPNRYEAASVIKHGDYYYLLGSSNPCCNGPLTGYSVFAGRSKDPRGPFVDREGVPLTAGRVGGTPVLGLNGNRWVGPGHNTIITDLSGQD
jgi:arabinan endo-1,5-alpha-L-arabinosidase